MLQHSTPTAIVPDTMPEQSSQKNGESNQPFFIVGCGRSGTTLLREMLNAHPRLATPPECPFLVEYLERPNMSARKAAKLLANEPFVKEWELGITPEKFSDCTDVTQVVVRLHELYLEHAESERWGQKTPKFVRHLPLLTQRFPHAKFIHLIRDGRAVAASYLRATWGVNNTVAAADYWRWNVELGLRFAEQYPEKCLAIQYESLLTDAPTVMRKVLEFLGEPFDDRVVSYEEHTSPMLTPVVRQQFELLGKPVDTNRATAWKKKLSEKQIKSFEAVSGDLLSKLNYERLYPDVKQMGKGRRSLWYLLDKAQRGLNHSRVATKIPVHYAYEIKRRLFMCLEHKG